MKKKVLAALLVGMFVLGGTTAYAAYDIQQSLKWSKDIVRFKGGCFDNTSATEGESCGRVTVFEYEDDRCYVAYENVHKESTDVNPSMSCVKR